MCLCGLALLALGVIVGAFGAHALKPVLLENQTLDTFQTGMNYWFYHALGLLGLSAWRYKQDAPLLAWAGVSILVGIFFFCGSLLILSVSGIKWLGAVAPIGGLGFIVGWLLAFWTVWRNFEKNQ
ncbi:MAG: DUF423 domain-containing protein [Cytophagales bacterium]|nr:MAG: DUF423 domain-containing protein [Cytophagales bacterium]TAF62313.1 MAG: DUF423 domain-containing protein [Cytophagales bacterium]